MMPLLSFRAVLGPMLYATALALPAAAQTTVTTTAPAPAIAQPAAPAASAAPAVSSTPEERIQALQARITEDAGKGILKTEAVTALEGKQAELENQVSRLHGKVTLDEQAALNISIQEQETRLKRYEQLAKPAHGGVDPSSVPPPTYVTPNGTAIIAPGGAYGNSGVVIPQNGPVMNPAPSNLQPATGSGQ